MRAFTVVDVAQRSPEWFAARVGRLTGSCADKMLATIKTGEAAARRDLRVRLVLERVTGRSHESGYVNDDMQWGIDHEAEALEVYEALTGDFVTRTGFLQHTDLLVGCSLDGHLGDFETLVSIKCPKSATHLKNLRANGMPPDYVPQMLHELWITGASGYHFLSFDPRFPDSLRTCLVRVARDERAVQDYADKAKAFLQEIDRECEALATMAHMADRLTAAAV